jgi:hypothetical protein
MLREWILAAGIGLIEIVPTPAGYNLTVCLTHDIDFVGIRRHKFDHSMLGFLYRATVGSVSRFLKGRLSALRLLQCWKAAASLPLVYAGLIEDFWEPFSWYLHVESGLAATYYMIPIKGRAGTRVPGAGASRRAAPYDVTEVRDSIHRLLKAGCEVGVHGIDAWHDAVQGKQEMARVADVTHVRPLGVRMHWLLQDARTPAVLELAGYAYDSTAGYNETVGFRQGTAQVFQPLGARTLLELPMHIQDGALFYPQRLNLSEPEAVDRCRGLLSAVTRFGGVLTVLWHDRSHGPERFWGDFYVQLIDMLKASKPWFATAAQAVAWFGHRRAVRFSGASEGTITLAGDGRPIDPPFTVRVFPGRTANGSGRPYTDITWDARTALVVDLARPNATSLAQAAEAVV